MLSKVPWFTRWPDRKLEWALAFYTLFFGIMLCLPVPSMTSIGFTVALELMPEWAWGAIYVAVGIVHNLALHVNGRAAWTPFARVAALLLNSQVFFALALKIAEVSPWSTGVFTYGFFAFGFCGVAIFTAAYDCGREIKIWRKRDGRV